MGRAIKKGSIDQSAVVRIIDATDGTPETGVTSATSGLTLEYRRELGATTGIGAFSDLAALTTAHADGGIKHIGNGYYRVDVPDAAFATGANNVLVHGTATGMVVIGNEYPLVDHDPQDAVRLGLTALPNAAANAAGGLPVSDAGGLDLDATVGALTFTVAGKVDANATHAAGTAWNSGAIGAATLAADTITAAKIAADAIDAAALDATAIAEIADGVLDEAIAEPGGVFAWAGGSLRSIVGFLGALGRNKVTQTATVFTLRNDADAGNIATAGVSDDGTTFTRAELS